MTQASIFLPMERLGFLFATAATQSGSGAVLAVQAPGRLNEIDLSCICAGHSCSMRLSASEARAVAAELIAAAAALEAAQGRA